MLMQTVEGARVGSRGEVNRERFNRIAIMVIIQAEFIHNVINRLEIYSSNVQFALAKI